MSERRDQGIATLLSRLAGQEMLGFEVTAGVAATAVTKLGSTKTGTGKPPPRMPVAAR